MVDVNGQDEMVTYSGKINCRVCRKKKKDMGKTK